MDHSKARLPRNLQELTETSEDTVLINTENPTTVLADLTSWAILQEIDLENLEVSKQNLEDIYLGILK